MAAELQSPALSTEGEEAAAAPPPVGEQDLEASASGPSTAPRPQRLGRLAGAAAAAAVLLLGGAALAHGGGGGVVHSHGFPSDADLVSFSLSKMKNSTKLAKKRKTKERALEVNLTELPKPEDDLDARVERATLQADKIGSSRALEEGMHQLADSISKGDRVDIVEALRSLRLSVKKLIGEVKSLETGLNMCGRIVCSGNFTCCAGLCCGEASICCLGTNGVGICCAPGGVCCPGLNGEGLCGAPGGVCKGGVVLAR